MDDGKEEKPYDGPSSAQFYPDSESDTGTAEFIHGDSDTEIEQNNEDLSDTELEDPAPATVQQPAPVVRRRSSRISSNSISAGILTRSRAKRMRNLGDHLTPPISSKRAARCLDDYLNGP